MKNLENAKVLNEVEINEVTGGDGLPTIFNPGDPNPGNPYGQTNATPVPEKPAQPEPAPGPMGQQATFEENQQAALNLHFSNR